MQEEIQQTMAQVVYYLCRKGKVEPPHMIDVDFRSPGLRLRDVKSRLTVLRGSRMPVMYSWSFKRIYKNASIWQDVSDDDFVLPVSSGEYVLKGSEIVENSLGQVLKSQSLKQPTEILQRRFWGAESWLTALDVPKPRMIPQPEQMISATQMVAQRKSWEPAQASKSGALKRLSVTDSSSSDEKESHLKAGSNNDPDFEAVRHSTGNILQDTILQDAAGIQSAKMYAVKPPVMADHGCDAATQTTEEVRRRKLGLLQNAVIADHREKLPVEDNKSKLQKDEVLSAPLGTSGSKKQVGSRLRKVFSQEKEATDLGKLKTKNGSSSSSSSSSSPWVFLHVLSYCGGLDTKPRGGNSPVLVTKEVSSSEFSHDDQSGGSRTDGDNFSFSDASRETQHSRTSTTGDSFNSSDTSDEGRAHKISAFVDVKEMLASANSTSSSSSQTGVSKSLSLLGRQYGRLSKSAGTYCPRDVKYDTSRRQHELKAELNCYNAE